MAMKPCNKCLENRWGQFENYGSITRATCQMCGNEVEWMRISKTTRFFNADKPAPINAKITEEGQVCRKCGTPVVRCEHKNPPSYKPGGYYFKSWLKCPHPRCRTLYMLESEKVFFDGTPVVQRASVTSPVMLPTAPDDPNFAPRPHSIMPWEENDAEVKA